MVAFFLMIWLAADAQLPFAPWPCEQHSFEQVEQTISLEYHAVEIFDRARSFRIQLFHQMASCMLDRKITTCSH